MHEIFFEKRPYTIRSPISSVESLNSSDSDEFSNLWSLGLQISQGLRPYVPEADSEEYSLFSDNERAYLKVMKQCWDGVPVNRPSFCDLTHIFPKWL
jgi:hypothetical protein